MWVNDDRFVTVFGNTPPGDDDNLLVRVAVAAVRAGYAIVPCERDTKKPICTLTARGSKAADKEAQVAAKEAGHPRWAKVRHACGIAHALTDDTVARRVMQRLVEQQGAVNLGVELGRSRKLVIDVDTPAEREAFLADWSAESGRDESGRTPTVLSPGVCRVEADGEERWVHKDGGHYWFDIPPGVTLPEGQGVFKAEGGWVAMWAGHQVLVPPSTRPEGPYRLAGQMEVAPDWLIDRILMEVHARDERKRINSSRIIDSDNPIDSWSREVEWAEILELDGWTDTGLVDRCSCPVWTAPGDHGSPKSATAHDLGCTRFDLERGHGPLHLWTDNPPEFLRPAPTGVGGGRTVTRAQYMAWRDHGGDVGEFVRVLTLEPAPYRATLNDDLAALAAPSAGKEDSGDAALPQATLPPPKKSTWVDAYRGKAFPLDVLPPTLRKFIAQGAVETEVDPTMLAPFVMACLGAAIGRSRCIEIRGSWRPTPCLFVVTIAYSGEGKSPAFELAAEPIYDIHWELKQKFLDEMSEYRALSKDEQKDVEPPVRQHLFTNDGTIESWRKLLVRHPRGMVAWQDEISGLLSRIEGEYKRSGASSDRARLLSIWSGGPWVTTRVNEDENVDVRHAFVTIGGGIQPGPAIRQLLYSDDGMTQRFLLNAPPIIPDEQVQESPPSVETAVKEAYSVLLCRAYQLQPDEAGEPRVIPYAAGAHELLGRELKKFKLEGRSDDLPQRVQQFWPKIREYIGRLAIILCEAWHLETGAPERITEEYIEGAVRILDYYRGQILEIVADEKFGSGDDDNDPLGQVTPAIAKEALRWVRDQPGGRSTKRGLSKNGPSKVRNLRPQAYAEMLGWLQARGDWEMRPGERKGSIELIALEKEA